MSDFGNLPPIESRFSRSWDVQVDGSPYDTDGNFNPDCLREVTLPAASIESIARIAGVTHPEINPYVNVIEDIDEDGDNFYILEVEIPHDDMDALRAFEQEGEPDIII